MDMQIIHRFIQGVHLNPGDEDNNVSSPENRTDRQRCYIATHLTNNITSQRV